MWKNRKEIALIGTDINVGNRFSLFAQFRSAYLPFYVTRVHTHTHMRGVEGKYHVMTSRDMANALSVAIDDDVDRSSSEKPDQNEQEKKSEKEKKNSRNIYAV